VRHLLLRARSLPHRAARGHAVRRTLVSRYLAAHPEPRLQIGSGPVSLPGWLNSDLIGGDVYVDLGRPLPFPDRSFAYVYGEHVIEHLSERGGERLLAEAYRVLREGGVLRLATPDLAKLIALYEDRNPAVDLATYARYLSELTGTRHERPCQVLNATLRSWGHLYVYDEADLRAKLERAGFSTIERVEAGNSAHAPLRGLEWDRGAEWLNRAEALCVEATR
jgi:predicted SAM-dependent methyltransferase